MDAPSFRLVANTAQKEYKNADGRLYWSHAITKQSVWEKPDELRVRATELDAANYRRRLR